MRQREEDERKAQLAEAVAVTERARADVERREAGVAAAQQAERDHVARAAERASHGVAAADMMSARAYRDRLIANIGAAERALAEARDNLAEVEAEEQTARDELATAIRERKAVDAHYEAWQAARKVERDRKAELAADDVAQMLHRRDDD